MRTVFSATDCAVLTEFKGVSLASSLTGLVCFHWDLSSNISRQKQHSPLHFEPKSVIGTFFPGQTQFFIYSGHSIYGDGFHKFLPDEGKNKYHFHIFLLTIELVTDDY